MKVLASEEEERESVGLPIFIQVLKKLFDSLKTRYMVTLNKFHKYKYVSISSILLHSSVLSFQSNYIGI